MIPLVTVITITYNLLDAKRREVFLECLNSVHSQDYANIEHIVIDGASTDGTLTLLEDYRNKGWIDVYSGPDSGIYDAFNKGLRKATGKYILFLNSDDLLLSNSAIAEAVKAMEDNDADFCYGDVKCLPPFDSHRKVRKVDLCRMFYAMPFCHQSMFVRTELLRKLGGFDERFAIAADYDLVLKLILNKYKSVQIPSCMIGFRGGGISSNKCLVNKDYMKVVQERYQEFYNLSTDEAYDIIYNEILPWSIVKTFSEYYTGKNKYVFLINSLLFRLRKFRRNLLQLRTSKGNISLKLFGIDIIKPKNV